MDRERRWFLVGYLVLLPLYLAPLAVTRFLPGLDLPFHLSMADLLAKVGDPAAPHGAIWEARLGLSPYAAYFWALRALGVALPLALAHKLLAALYVAALPLALASLARAVGASALPALLAFPLAYNLPLHYGFVSFAFALPLVLWLLARVAALLDGAAPRRDALAAAALALALFTWHLQAWLFGVAGVLAMAAARRAPVSRRALAMASLLPSLGGFAWWQRHESYVADPSHRSARYALELIWQSADFRHGYLLGSLRDRLLAFPDLLLRGFTDGVDEIAVVLLVMLWAAYLVLGVATRRAAPPTRPGWAPARALLVAGAAAAFFLLPRHLAEFNLFTFYPRFGVLLAALALVALPSSLRARPALVMAPALALAAWYGGALTREYRRFGVETADFATVLDRAPPGGRAVGLVFDRASHVLRVESSLLSLPAYYPVERRAPGSLVDVLYCDARHMPCRVRAPALRPPAPSPWDPRALDRERGIPWFDYFFVRGGPPAREIFGDAPVEVLAHAGTWTLYRRAR